MGAILCGMTAIYFGITVSFLVERYTITTKAAMMHDLLELMYCELRKTRIAFVFIMLGLTQIVIGTMLFVYFV